MSVSCQFFAEGAVRLPSGRFIPKAAHKRFDRVCIGSFSPLNVRVDILSFNADMSGFPPSLWGLGSCMDEGPAA